MMKKFFLVTALVLLVLTAGFAEGTTWTNPYDLDNLQIPRSMISVISNGTVYDAVDVLLTSPAELSDYPGVVIYTGYGNYQSYNGYSLGAPTDYPVDAINPFATNSTSSIDGIYANGDTGNGNVAFQLGYMMPIFNYQSGIILGFEEFITENLDGYSGTNREYTSNTSHVEDTNVDGTSGYSASSNYTYTDYSVDNSLTFGTGVDLDFMGISLYCNFNDGTRFLGGTYDYALTPGADTVDFDPTGGEYTTSKTITYGYNEGETGSYIVNNNEWAFILTGELPLELADISMPVTASLQVYGEGDGSTSYNIPQTVVVSDSYVDTDGAGGAAEDVSTLSYTVGVTNLDSATISGEHINATTPVTASAAWADVTTAVGGNYAQNPDGIIDGLFGLSVTGRIDPEVEISDILTAKTRAQVSVGYESEVDTISGIRTVQYSRADSASENSTYSYSATTTNPSEKSTLILNFELGGILEAKTKNNMLTVSSGLFYNPNFDLQSTANKDEVTVITASAVDNTGTLAEVTNASTVANVGLGAADVQGTVTETTTVSYTGKSTENTIDHRFIIPVSAKVNLFDDKLSIIGGYTLANTITNTITSTPDSTSTMVTTCATTGGTDVSPAASTSINSTTTGTVVNNWSSTDWEGYMNFMVRWLPTDFVTVDLFGQSIMTALNMDLFGGGTSAGNDGLNLNYIISNLGMSLTFHFSE